MLEQTQANVTVDNEKQREKQNSTESCANVEGDIFNITVTPTSTGRTSKKRLLGPPPEEIYEDFEGVICSLEELWAVDLGTFENVEKIAQLLMLREGTWRRLCSIQRESQTNLKGNQLDESDLFDVVF